MVVDPWGARKARQTHTLRRFKRDFSAWAEKSRREGIAPG